MQIFLDSADIKEIDEINQLGIIDGITTNPSLMSKTKYDFVSTIAEICKIITSDVSVEVVANDVDTMINQGNKILEISSNIAIKLPMTWNGIKACQYFADKGKKVNMTLCFSVNQALIAAKAGAFYISPFIGRLDDIGQNGISLISDIRQVYDNYQYQTKILAASIRSPNHVYQAAMYKADVATMSGKIIKQLLNHPLTDSGLEIFNKDWSKSGLEI
ncbi:MAG: fructose-6-phosphate aldolase [Rickettsia endosymbiont of Culicoides impunctatus]|nr:fructose-6-phosphate aldolase [Rickettsia endosymbiont of Platyusa sonomae]MCC8416827.1 fructose-6-phosphate aldolase [Rickettsia endosymbiont of Gnoriste bilineata]UCM85305.1 MAG: fructose-6-phosphate aldolase [Rickettsia endosymbiont of Culicoides impunctatus]